MRERELEELKVSIFDKIRRAVTDGDKDKALALLGELEANSHDLRGIYLTWVDLLLSYIADKLGEDALYETMRLYDQRAVRPALQGAFGKDIGAEDRLRRRTYVMTSLYGINFDEIQEDEEKFTLQFRCPSGGVVRRREQYGKTKEAHPWSWGEKDMAYYCTHCATSLEIMTIELLGHPAWVITHEPDGVCVQRIYKDPEAVPEEYYKRVGMGKKTEN